MRRIQLGPGNWAKWGLYVVIAAFFLAIALITLIRSLS